MGRREVAMRIFVIRFLVGFGCAVGAVVSFVGLPVIAIALLGFVQLV